MGETVVGIRESRHFFVSFKSFFWLKCVFIVCSFFYFYFLKPKPPHDKCLFSFFQSSPFPFLSLPLFPPFSFPLLHTHTHTNFPPLTSIFAIQPFNLIYPFTLLFYTLFFFKKIYSFDVNFWIEKKKWHETWHSRSKLICLERAKCGQ